MQMTFDAAANVFSFLHHLENTARFWNLCQCA